MRTIRQALELDKKEAGMYFDNNAVATVIETASIPILLRNMTAGKLSGWTYQAGSTGEIAAFADYGTTVTGAVSITCTAHGLVTGDIISIRGTTNYNGVFAITKIDDNTFYIMDTWVVDDGVSDWDQGDYLLAGVDAAGDYAMMFHESVISAATGVTAKLQIYINAITCDKCIGARKFANTDQGNLIGGSNVTIAAGDRLAWALISSGTGNFTIQYGNIYLHRV